jgi:hypothetical protein
MKELQNVNLHFSLSWIIVILGTVLYKKGKKRPMLLVFKCCTGKLPICSLIHGGHQFTHLSRVVEVSNFGMDASEQ